MAAKIYAGDLFKCKVCALEIRVIKAGNEAEAKQDTQLTCCDEEMENIGGLDPANSW